MNLIEIKKEMALLKWRKANCEKIWQELRDEMKTREKEIQGYIEQLIKLNKQKKELEK